MTRGALRRRAGAVLAWLVLAALPAGCGGGSSGGGSTSSSAASGSGFTSTSGTDVVLPGATTPAANQLAVKVEPFTSLGQLVNVPYVTVTVCDASSRCVDVDHVVLDTGSYGFRVNAATVSALNLPPLPSGTGTLAECATFVSGTLWGSVAQATLRMGDEVAPNVPIQLIDASAAGGSPSGCTSRGADLSTVQRLGGNGVLGVGLFATDLGGGGLYFACQGGSCARVTSVPTQPVRNPVTLFATDNNGLILQMPALGRTGAATATGLLTFGIDTATDNSIADYAVLPADPRGNFTATLQGVAYDRSFFDSGSNQNFATVSGVQLTKSGTYAPTDYTVYPLQLTPNAGGASITSQLALISPAALNLTTDHAFDDLGSPGIGSGAQGSVDLGLPAFFGQANALLFSGMRTAQGVGPLYAIH